MAGPQREERARARPRVQRRELARAGARVKKRRADAVDVDVVAHLLDVDADLAVARHRERHHRCRSARG